MSRPTLALVALALTLAVPAVARGQGDARTRAAEHFALAQAAEARKDWRAAIAEYEEAYRLAPHPSVLFNIAVDHERLGDARAAVRYFLRYVDAAPDAGDRDAVLRRIDRLRRAPSTVQFTTKPDGATIVVDGRALGPAPLTVALDAGAHTIVAEHQGRRSVPRRVDLEYGDPLAISIDLFALPGLLVVDADRAGAEVRVDGALVGQTPLTVELAAGPHQVLVSLAGHHSEQRAIEVPPQGSVQVRARLAPLPTAEGGPPPPSPDRPGALVLGTSYGFTANQDGQFRYGVDLGWRTGNQRLELAALFGFYGADLGAGLGAGARVYLGTGGLRPYLRVAGLFGGGEDSPAFEGGVGVLLTRARGDATATPLGIEYFVEIDYQLRGDVEDDGFAAASTGRPIAAVAVPVVFGVAFRFGR